jgi:hypothetical protein
LRLRVVDVAVNRCTNLSPANDNCTIVYCIWRANLFIYAPFRFGSRVGKRPVVGAEVLYFGLPENLNEKGNFL